MKFSLFLLLYLVSGFLLSSTTKAQDSVWIGETWDTGNGIVFSTLIPSGTVYRVAIAVGMGVTLEDGKSTAGATVHYSSNLIRVGGAEEFDACIPESVGGGTTGPLKVGDSLTITDYPSRSLVYLTIKEIQPDPWKVGVRVSYLILANLPKCADDQKVSLCLFEDEDPVDHFENARLLKIGMPDLPPIRISNGCSNWIFEDSNYSMPYTLIVSSLTLDPIEPRVCLDINGIRDTVNEATFQVNHLLTQSRIKERIKGGQNKNGKYFKRTITTKIFKEEHPDDFDYVIIDDYLGDDIYSFSLKMHRDSADNCYVLPIDSMEQPRNITGLYTIVIEIRS